MNWILVASDFDTHHGNERKSALLDATTKANSDPFMLEEKLSDNKPLDCRCPSMTWLQSAMAVLITITLAIYLSLLGWCPLLSREYAILKTSVILTSGLLFVFCWFGHSVAQERSLFDLKAVADKSAPDVEDFGETIQDGG